MPAYGKTLMALILALITAACGRGGPDEQRGMSPAAGQGAGALPVGPGGDGATATDVATEVDLPPLGRSRFDQLIGAGPVPFPFQRLLARIESQLGADPGLAPVKTVLIPLGRSLQRAAGAPDFFRFPRAVLAVDGDTRPGIAPMKDRLFLGYHEKGAVLEVISYNEAAGRFEFQLVRDYRPGGRPELVYARRALCLACHQNRAPIFARPLWDETPANVAIADRLKAAGRSFYGIPLAGTDIAYFYDAATDRANLLPVWQRIWREGCGPGPAGDACRRQLFAAALAFGLSGVRPDAAALDALAPELDRRWPGLWPGGLAIPNPDIPNRDPFARVPDAAHPPGLPGELAQASRIVHIPARFEPLNPRPPLELWPTPDKARLLAGLAGMLAAADLDALDQALAARPAASRKIALDCGLRAKPGGRVVFSCAGGGLEVEGVYSAGRQRVSGRIDRLSLAGAPAGIHLEGEPRGPGATLRPRFNGRHARLHDGRRLAALVVAPGQGSLRVIDDFAPVHAALAGLPSAREQGQAGQASPPPPTATFPAWRGMAELLAALGAAPRRQADPDLPPPRAERPLTDGAGPAGDFRRYCGQCHDTADAAPPNFLHGGPERVAASLAQCAPRIHYRLSMWDLAEPRRGKTPMPPSPALAGHGLDAAGWTRSDARAGLLAHSRQLLAGQGLDPEALTARPFESLPPCLPQATTP